MSRPRRRARRDLELAEAAKRLAQEEAARLAKELEETEQRRQTEEQVEREQQRRRLEQEQELANKQLEAALKQQEDLSSTIVRIREGVSPDTARANEREGQLRAELEQFETQLAEADERVDAAEQAKSVAKNAHSSRLKFSSLHQRAAEDELRLKLYDEVEGWLGEERKQSEAELERLRRLEEGLERIQAEKAEAQQQAQSAAADLDGRHQLTARGRRVASHHRRASCIARPRRPGRARDGKRLESAKRWRRPASSSKR